MIPRELYEVETEEPGKGCFGCAIASFAAAGVICGLWLGWVFK